MEDEIEASGALDVNFPGCPIEKGRYKNPHVHDTKRKLVDFLKWRFGFFTDRHPKIVAPKSFSYPNPLDLNDKKPKVTWINHSTFLVTFKKINLLTDPIWSHRCSPSKIIGPKRLHKPPMDIQDLNNISIVLISHDHYDHLDKATVKEIVSHNPNVLFFVPQGLKKWFLKRGITNVRELSWWESSFVSFSEKENIGIQVTAVPSQHFSGRTLFGKNKTLWCGFVVKFYDSGNLMKTMYFVGDTGYNPFDFKNIGDAFGEMDLSLIPIGTYLPYSFMAPVHICPEKAVKIHQEVRSKLSIGMHWKTFKLSEEMQHQPPFDLYCNMLENKLDPLTFRAIHPGQGINW